MLEKQPVQQSSFSKCKSLFRNPSLLFEFQTETVKLLVYNYAIVLLIANQDVGWNYKFNGIEIASRFGQELIEPTILPKFGLCFRLLTVIFNTLAANAILNPKRYNRKFLLPCILWNFYSITAVAENIFEIVWTMYVLDVPFHLFVTISMVGIFMICLQSKLTLQVLRFYEYLNYK
ncbi:PREDICTED: uncharacterized protein LOC108362429 [Rhagoletis zephyria]|uniref:uncharacterized protein LOC108362429 n=1 Tax=Rhagoletis zephyria TaxID=28612 RepID=UPI0008113CCB|nr:PREDICTED: uncharacterized protein LOC108362429 [Rhagoletis zephyria]XP_036331125.1 uncharacterized protein LOC118742838 [Rhagoletis pomonella]